MTSNTDNVMTLSASSDIVSGKTSLMYALNGSTIQNIPTIGKK